jgi:hypothetical protein
MRRLEVSGRPETNGPQKWAALAKVVLHKATNGSRLNTFDHGPGGQGRQTN